MMKGSDSNVQKLFKLHSSRGSAPAKHDAVSDLRKMAGAPGRMMAGAPGRMMSGSYRTMGGPKLTIEEKASPQHNPVVRKLMFPKSLMIRIPDNNRLPTVTVNYANFSTSRVGTDIPMSPYFLFLPAHNIGLFVVGGIITINGVTRFLPTMNMPSSRDLSAYTRARNEATRIGVRSGSISAANVQLKGTFNGNAFYELRDFKAFDVAEFSTRCITISDYVQGVRSDNGVTFISGPEMIPDLRPINTTELYGNEDSLQIRYDYEGKSTKAAWQGFKVYDYFDSSSDKYGPLMGDNTLTIFLESTGTSASTGTTFQGYVSISVIRSIINAAGTKVDNTEKYECNTIFCVDSGKISFSLTMMIPPASVWVGWITNITVSLYVGDVYDYKLRFRITVPGQFSLGYLGPGFVLAGLGFEKDSEIVTDVTRSMSAVAGGTLQLDVKPNMTPYVPTKLKHMERAIAAFNTPSLPIRRVYTKFDFFNYALSVNGVKQMPTSGVDLASFETEDRLMAGPISGIIKGVAPMLSFIPGIGGIASGIGNVLGGVAEGLGFSGPTNKTELNVTDDFKQLTHDMHPSCLTHMDEDMGIDDCDYPLPMQTLDEVDETESPGTDDENEWVDEVCEGRLENIVRHLAERGSLLGANAGRDNLLSETLERWLQKYPHTPKPGFSVDMNSSNLIDMSKCKISYEPEAHTPEQQLTLEDVMNTVNESLTNVRTINRYQLALMGAPILDEHTVVANVVGITNNGIASIELIVISDYPCESYDSNESTYLTPYQTIVFGLPDLDPEAVTFHVSEDFHPARHGDAVNASLTCIASALIYSGRGKARASQYITLPKPGIAAGPSLGISTAIACLGIIDPDNVFSGGFTISDGIPTVTEISGTLLKAVEAGKRKLTLICTEEAEMRDFLNKEVQREDGTVAHPYVSANCLPAGIPVTETRAIVVYTILEALSMGRTLTSSKSILTETPAEATAKRRAKEIEASNKKARFQEAEAAGNYVIPPSISKFYNIPEVCTQADLEGLPFLTDVEVVISTLKTETAKENTRNLLNAVLAHLDKGDMAAAYNGMNSLGEMLISYKNKLERSNTTGTTSNAYQGRTVGELLAGRSRKRPKQTAGQSSSSTTQPASTRQGVRFGPAAPIAPMEVTDARQVITAKKAQGSFGQKATNPLAARKTIGKGALINIGAVTKPAPVSTSKYLLSKIPGWGS